MGDKLSIEKFCKTKFDKNILSEENYERMKNKSNETIHLYHTNKNYSFQHQNKIENKEINKHFLYVETFLM